MNARVIFLQALLPLLAQWQRSPNRALAAEAADEHAVKARELAKLLRAQADQSPDAASSDVPATAA
jgi:hypothetical protein